MIINDMQEPKITEADIIRFIREEWQSRIDRINEKMETTVQLPAGSGDSVNRRVPVVKPGLKVFDDDGHMSVVSAVDNRSGRFILQNPDDFNTTAISTDELENEYDTTRPKTPGSSGKPSKESRPGVNHGQQKKQPAK